MPLEICAVGGYKEVGRNCTAIKIDNDVIILDLGLHMENYVKYTETEDVHDLTARQLTSVNAVPDTAHIEDWKDNIHAIIPSHAHLDHIGAIPFMEKSFNAPIIATPFTIEVIKELKEEEFKNKLVKINPNSSHHINEHLNVEFINSTHSTLQSSMLAVHSKYGTVLYATDFKFDDTPVIGPKPNYARLKQLKGNVKLLITECLYAEQQQKMPSEMVARQLLREVMLQTNMKNKGVIITTFSSHISRLKSIIDFGRKLNRKIIFLGRSLNKYVSAAERLSLVNFTKDVGMILYGERARKALRKFAKEKEKYLLVMTGHQGEPNSMLSRIVDGVYEFPINSGDFIIFSAPTIPTPTTKANRQLIETKLKDKGARLFTDIHVSGHAGREDLRELIEMVAPEHIIPMHGEPRMLASLADLASQLGYTNENVHLLFNGQMLKLG